MYKHKGCNWFTKIINIVFVFLLFNMISTWCYNILIVLALMFSGISVLIVLVFLLFLVPIGLAKAFLVSGQRIKFLKDIGLTHLRDDSRPILLQLYSTEGRTLSLYFKIEKFLVFYSRFEFIVFVSPKFPESLMKKLNEDENDEAFVNLTLSLNRILTHDQLRTKQLNLPPLVVCLSNQQLHHWLKYDSASQHFHQTSILGLCQNALRPALPKITPYLIPKNCALCAVSTAADLEALIKQEYSLAEVSKMTFKKTVLKGFMDHE